MDVPGFEERGRQTGRLAKPHGATCEPSGHHATYAEWISASLIGICHAAESIARLCSGPLE
jgi:hypothetical protein